MAGSSLSAMSGRTTPITKYTMTSATSVTSLTGDTSDDFLLLSDSGSQSYEDIENIDVECTPSAPPVDVDIKSENSSLLSQPNIRITATTSIATIYSIRQYQCQFIYYVLIIFSIIIYLYSYARYISHYNQYLEVYSLEILYVNVFYVMSILFYLFLIVLCLIFGYQYKMDKQKRNPSQKVTLSMILSRINKSKVSKTRHCMDILTFYRKIFSFEWTEFGIVCILTLTHYILSALLMLYQVNNYKNTFYDLSSYILSSICYILNGCAIVLLALCLNIYHDHLQRRLLYSNFEYSKSDHTNTVDIIPENQQTDGRVIHMTTSTNPTKDAQSALYDLYPTQAPRNIPTLFNDALIRFMICIIFIILFIVYHMLCIVNWDCYKSTNNIIYGDDVTQNIHFIVNELLLKLYSAILLSNTCLRFIFAHDTKSYGFVSYIIKPHHVLLVILMSFVELQMHSERTWNVICVDIYGVLVVILFLIWCLIFGTANKIRQRFPVDPSENTSICKCVVIDGIILIILSVIASVLLLLSDHNHWLHIRQICLNIFNVMQLVLICTLKWIIADPLCYKYIALDRLYRGRLRSLLIKLIMLNMYHISYLLIFFVRYYGNILDHDDNIYYRLSFVLSFAHIQLTQWILRKLLCLYVELVPPNAAARNTKTYLGSGNHRYSTSARGYSIKKPKSKSKSKSNVRNLL